MGHKLLNHPRRNQLSFFPFHYMSKRTCVPLFVSFYRNRKCFCNLTTIHKGQRHICKYFILSSWWFLNFEIGGNIAQITDIMIIFKDFLKFKVILIKDIECFLCFSPFLVCNIKVASSVLTFISIVSFTEKKVGSFFSPARHSRTPCHLHMAQPCQ